MTTLSKSLIQSERIHAVILAAGVGKRLRPLTDNMPKCLTEVNGKSIIFRQLTSLAEHHITDVWIVVGYYEDLVRKYVQENFSRLNIRFITNRDFTKTNTLYSLALAASKIPAGARVILLNGDVVFDSNILGVLLLSDSSLSFIAIRVGKCGEEEIKIVLAPDGSISEINKKVPTDKTFGEAVGINLFSKTFWRGLSEQLSKLRDGHPTEYFEYAVEDAIKSGLKVFPSDIGDFRAIEIDFPLDLGKAEQLFSVAL